MKLKFNSSFDKTDLNIYPSPLILECKWAMLKHKIIENKFALQSEPKHQCGDLSLFCYWVNSDQAKEKCLEWAECKLIKESDKSPPTVSGVPIFWAMKSGVMTEDIKPSTGENVWVCEDIGISLKLGK